MCHIGLTKSLKFSDLCIRQPDPAHMVLHADLNRSGERVQSGGHNSLRFRFHITVRNRPELGIDLARDLLFWPKT
jgi:hypothetical protein